jgi:hypothetical protein
MAAGTAGTLGGFERGFREDEDGLATKTVPEDVVAAKTVPEERDDVEDTPARG